MVADAISTTTWSDWAIPPGDFLADTLESLGMSQSELASRTNRPPQVINEIIRGKKMITADTAIELERVLGVPAHIWLGLENEYQLTLARLRARQAAEEESPLIDQFPLKEMERLGWLAPSPPRDAVAKVGALQHFFGVATLQAVTERRVLPNAALRVSQRAKVKQGSLLAWLRKGVLDAATVDTDPFDRASFERVLLQVRAFTREDPTMFVPEMIRLCSAAGVALVLVPELPGTGANGCTRWVSRSKAMIQLNLRYKWADIFWFTFFHEACHVLRRQLSQVFVDLVVREGDGAEADADRFAADTLIPPHVWQDFVDLSISNEAGVRAFAERAGVHPGIVVGRAQREVWSRYDLLNSLRVKYRWEEET